MAPFLWNLRKRYKGGPNKEFSPSKNLQKVECPPPPINGSGRVLRMMYDQFFVHATDDKKFMPSTPQIYAHFPFEESNFT